MGALKKTQPRPRVKKRVKDGTSAATPQRSQHQKLQEKAPGAAQFTVVLEDLRSQFTVFGEALSGMRDEMNRRFDAVDRRFEAVDRRFDAVDQRFEAVDQRFEAVDQRFETVDRRFERVEGDLGLVKNAVLENTRELKGLRDSIALIAERKPDRDEVAAVVREIVGERAH